MSTRTLADAAIDALVEARHGDPFGLLGPHGVRIGGRERMVVRVLRPAARRVELLTPAGDVEMSRCHPDGLFEATLDREPAGYRLRLHDAEGRATEVDDPYRFGVVLSDAALEGFERGEDDRVFEKLGAHPATRDGVHGFHFAVWAPNAERVSVVGDLDAWDGRVHAMRRIRAGVWEIFIPGLEPGARYKFEIRTPQGHILLKTDPYGRTFEAPPGLAALTWDPSGYGWGDQAWRAAARERGIGLDRPMAVYEVHLASWAKVTTEGNRSLTYEEAADRLVSYVVRLGFTHIELMPVMEHPFLGSWGYQATGFFAPTSRHGSPNGFKALVDACHAAGIGVILDWVPGHFPKDAVALARFDGTALYEHEDPRRGEHPDWGTLVFNYGRHEVRSFLLSSARFWLEEFHLDGLRVDAVASMLYLDYSRGRQDWVPNVHGGNENLEAIDFIRQLNALVHAVAPGATTVAEESTAWPGVSRPVYVGGLGFSYKWNMGWMHDMLEYMRKDPVHRRWHQDRLTFSMVYAYSENFVLPLSHDEVVHGKGSLVGKMPGDEWQRFANLRLLYGYMFAHPGKKLLFMGAEFGQPAEWNHDVSLDWHVLSEGPYHAGLSRYVTDLNAVYCSRPSLYQIDAEPAGFGWIDCTDAENAVLAFVRYGADREECTIAVANFTPVVREGYRIGVPDAGTYHELLNSDSAYYGGSNIGNGGELTTDAVAAHGRDQSLALTLPPLGCLWLGR